MEKHSAARIFVIGFMGSDRYGAAKKVAAEMGYAHIDLDKAIEAKENLSIAALCRARGEHEYRNKEYEALKALSKEDGVVVSCGDGIVLDEMCRDILKGQRVLLIKGDPEDLFERAKNDKSLPYSFLATGDETQKRKKFLELYEIRESLYNQCIEKFMEDRT